VCKLLTTHVNDKPKESKNTVESRVPKVPQYTKLVKYCKISLPDANPAPTIMPIKALPILKTRNMCSSIYIFYNDLNETLIQLVLFLFDHTVVDYHALYFLIILLKFLNYFNLF